MCLWLTIRVIFCNIVFSNAFSLVQTALDRSRAELNSVKRDYEQLSASFASASTQADEAKSTIAITHINLNFRFSHFLGFYSKQMR
jgi:hypothetical protein